MAIKTFIELRQEVAENLSILDTSQIEAFDSTTTPTLTRVNQYINDSLREITSSYPFEIMDRNCNIPFYHRVNNVPSASLVDENGLTGNITPYPNSESLETLCYEEEPNANYSGLAFVSNSGVSTVSVSGSLSTDSWDGVGYMYELPPDVDQILAITTPGNGNVKMSFTPYYDIQRVIPQGLLTSSGTTPTWYTQPNGLSADGNQMVQFYPAPDVSLSGSTFRLNYKKKEVDIVVDTGKQDVVPDNFQDIIVNATLEKSYALLSDMEKSSYHRGLKMQRLLELRKWCENNQDWVNRYRDGHYLSSLSYATGVDLATGYMINNFGN